MTEPNQQEINRKLLKRLEEKIEMYPTLRFGQIILNFFYPDVSAPKMFYFTPDPDTIDAPEADLRKR